MGSAANNRFVNIDITIPDLKVKTASRIGANPSFVVNSCPLTTEIRQGHQVSRVALLTLGKIELFHEVHLPAEIEFSTVYTKQWLLARAFLA